MLIQPLSHSFTFYFLLWSFIEVASAPGCAKAESRRARQPKSVYAKERQAKPTGILPN